MNTLRFTSKDTINFYFLILTLDRGSDMWKAVKKSFIHAAVANKEYENLTEKQAEQVLIAYSTYHGVPDYFFVVKTDPDSDDFMLFDEQGLWRFEGKNKVSVSFDALKGKHIITWRIEKGAV